MCKTVFFKVVKASILQVLVFAFYIIPSFSPAQCFDYDPVVPYIPTTSGSSACSAFPTNYMTLETSPNVNFTFNTMNEYTAGVTLTGSTILHLYVASGVAACKWKLIVVVNNGTAIPLPANWQQLVSYGNPAAGITPPISSLQMRIYNPCNTTTCNTWQWFAQNGQGLYIIAPQLGLPPVTGCGTNVDGLGS